MKYFPRLLLLGMLLLSSPGVAQQIGNNLSGRFIQERHLQGFSSPLRSEGSFLLAPERGLIWRVEKPFAMTTLIGPAGLLQQMDGRETMRLTADRMPLLSQLYTLLGAALNGDWQQLSSLNMLVVREEKGPGWRVELSPHSGMIGSTGIRRVVALGGLFVETLELEKASGDRDRLIFSDHRVATALSPADYALLGQVSIQ